MVASTRSSSSVASGVASCIVLMNACRTSQGVGSSSCSRLSVRIGGRTAARRTSLATVFSDSRVFSESRSVECVLIRALSEGVCMLSPVSVSCRLVTLTWIGMAVVSKPVSARHLMGPSSRNVGPEVWWKKDVLIALSNGSRVRITREGIVWIEVIFASFSALVVEVWKTFMILEHSSWIFRLSSWKMTKSDQFGICILLVFRLGVVGLFG